MCPIVSANSRVADCIAASRRATYKDLLFCYAVITSFTGYTITPSKLDDCFRGTEEFEVCKSVFANLCVAD